MFNPPHPGLTLRDDVLPALNMGVAEFAERLSMSRTAMSRVLNGHSSISPVLAIRLEKAGISTARAWLAVQASYDLWRAEQTEQPPIQRLTAA